MIVQLIFTIAIDAITVAVGDAGMTDVTSVTAKRDSRFSLEVKPMLSHRDALLQLRNKTR